VERVDQRDLNSFDMRDAPFIYHTSGLKNKQELWRKALGKDICIVTAFKKSTKKEYFTWSQYEEILPYTLWNMWKYAKHHGYRVYFFNGDVFDTSKKASWVKIPLIRRYFSMGCDWVFYTDVDWLFMSDAPLPVDNSYDLIVSNECIRGHEWKKMSGTMLIKNSDWSNDFLKRWENMYTRFKNKANHDQAAFEHMMRATPPQVKVLAPSEFMTYDTHACMPARFGIHFPAGNKPARVKKFATETGLSAVITGTRVFYQTPYAIRSSDIIVGILSSSKERRMKLRETYNNENIYFLVGYNGGFDYEEFYRYNDIIFINEKERYRGEDSILPYKTQVFFSIFADFDFKYLFKTDDDILVNFALLRAELDGVTPDYWGRVWLRNIINRDPRSRWYVSRETFSEAVYPPYCSGAGYVVSKRFVQCMKSQIATMKYMPNEDVATGILARMCHIDPVDAGSKIDHMGKGNQKNVIIRHYGSKFDHMGKRKISDMISKLSTHSDHCNNRLKNNMWDTFSAAITVLNRLNASYSISHGTVLFWYRDCTLGPSDIDIDIDLSWFRENHMDFRKMFINNGWKLMKNFGKKYERGYEESWTKNGIKVDFFTIDNKITGITVKGQTYSCFSFFEQYVQHTWNGLQFFVPEPVEPYLNKKYGDWKTKHIQGYQWDEEPFKRENGRYNCDKSKVL